MMSKDYQSEIKNALVDKDYSQMNFEKLVSEFKKVVKTDQIHLVKSQASQIKKSFDYQYDKKLKLKKDEFIESGGAPFEFSYQLPIKAEFDSIYREYKEKLRKYYDAFEKTLKENYKKKLEIINQIKALVDVEENINTTFKRFMELQTQWREAGPIPRINLEDTWQNYHHHVERFYDFLSINRELRDKDFAHNLDKKQQLIDRAKELSKEQDLQKVFREIKTLNKAWREDIGPVAKEYRESIWKEFNEALDVLYAKKTDYLKNLSQVYQDNTLKKEKVIGQMKNIIAESSTKIKDWNSNSKKISDLREEFLKIGKATEERNKMLWTAFRETINEYKLQRKTFFDKIKSEEQENLKKRHEFIEALEAFKDQEITEKTTSRIIQIQKDWKRIGRVSHKESNKTWEKFKGLCDQYFNKISTERDKELIERQQIILEEKKKLLETLTTYQLSEKDSENVIFLEDIMLRWGTLGALRSEHQFIEDSFKDNLEQLIAKMQLGTEELELLQYRTSISQNNTENGLLKERTKINRIHTEVTSELLKLENNKSFIKADDKSPILLNLNNKIAELNAKIEALDKKKKLLNKLIHRKNLKT